MGRTDKGKSRVDEQGELFRKEEVSVLTPHVTSVLTTAQSSSPVVGPPPSQSDAKSRLIADYVSRFQLVTGGGLYIDGFAAPQSRDHEEAWTARRVLEIQPPRLRRFWLCDLEEKGIAQLKALKSKHHRSPRSRHVHVVEGDFNETFKGILKSGRILRNTAVFALLDQRTAECHWSTVKRLAAHEGRTKIELLYFLGTGWLHRSLASSSTPQRLGALDRWWGGRGWRDLLDQSTTTMASTMADRFAHELGYRFVRFYPIFQGKDGRALFHLIHASDHPEAPKLMARAYQSVVGSVPGTPTDAQFDFHAIMDGSG